MGIRHVKIQNLFLCIRLMNERVGEISNENESETTMIQNLFLCIRLMNERVGEISNENESETTMNTALCRSHRSVLCSDASLSIACHKLLCCMVGIACNCDTLVWVVDTYRNLEYSTKSQCFCGSMACCTYPPHTNWTPSR
jgi:hypothetical protein